MFMPVPPIKPNPRARLGTNTIVNIDSTPNITPQRQTLALEEKASVAVDHLFYYSCSC